MKPWTKIISLVLATLTLASPRAIAESAEVHDIAVPMRLQDQNLTLFYDGREYPLRKTIRLHDTGSLKIGVLRDAKGRTRALITKWASPNFLKHVDAANFYLQPSASLTTIQGSAFKEATLSHIKFWDFGLQIGTFWGSLVYYLEYSQASGTSIRLVNSFEVESTYRAINYRLGAKYVLPNVHAGPIQEVSLFGGPTLVTHVFRLKDDVTHIDDDARSLGAFAGADIAMAMNEMLLGWRVSWTTMHVKADHIGLDDRILQSNQALYLRFFVR